MRFQQTVPAVVIAVVVSLLFGCSAWYKVSAEDKATEAEDLEKKGDFVGAADFYLAAVHEVQKGDPEGSDEEILYRSRRSSCLLRTGRPTDALIESKAAVALARRLHGPNHPSLAVALVPHAAALEALGLHDESHAAGEEVRRINATQSK